MSRRLTWGNARFLAVAVLLAGMAYVTWDTQQAVHRANDDRRALREQVIGLQSQVNALKAANVRKDSEIVRLNTLLISKGIDPRPAPTPTVIVNVPRQETPRSGASTSSPRPRSSPSPAPRRSSTPSPTPKPSPTCTAYNPATGGCLA